MEGSVLYFVVVLGFCLPTVSHSQLYTMITPNVLRVETEEKIVVEAHGLTASTTVTVTVRDFPFKRHILSQGQTTLTTQNGTMGTVTIKIPTRDLKKDVKQFVSVQAESPQFVLEKVILVSFHSGYIFIQTDKTIYTPGSSVNCRLFVVGHRLEPVLKPVAVELQTPEGIIVRRESISSSGKKGILPLTYHLPEIIPLGTWKIVARYEDSPQKSFSTQFEVKEYVLPSFEVTLVPSEKFFYIDGNENLTIHIHARFLYGKELKGTAYILFGVKIGNEKKSIPQSLKRIEISNGNGEAELTREMLQARFTNLTELIGHSIYAITTVLTESGSDMVEAELTGINIVTSPYQIHFTKTPKYFKPGMPFELMAYVTNPDGSPAYRVPVKVEGSQDSRLTQRDGTAKLIINTPGEPSPLPITVKTDHKSLPDNRQARKSMLAEPYQTEGETKNYLHLTVTSTDVKVGDYLVVNFHMKTSSSAVANQIQYFTYLILNKGKIIHAGRQPKEAGQTLVTMSLPITPNLLPSFRLLAYYQRGNSELVADSVWVDVQDTCMGRLVVKGASDADNKVHAPMSSMNIKVEGDAGAHVGLVVVDKAVYVLNKKHKLSQMKIWDTVEKNDIGCTPGSGKDNKGVFADAGLSLQTNIKISTPQRSDPECPQPGKRRRRSAHLVEYKANQVAKYQDQAVKKCCEDGMYENPMGHSCEKRAGYILDTAECKKAFLDCCNYIKKIRDERQREFLLELARSETDDWILEDEDITSRSQFPESWLWIVETLNEIQDKDGISSKTLHIHLMDSITTWEVLAVSLSETTGICVADPYEITVMKEFFIDLRLPYSVVRNEQVEIRAILYNYWQNDIKVRMELIHNPAFCSAATSKAKYRQTLEITAMSSRAVPLVIVPLELGLHDIEVKAAVWGTYVGDGVRKKLKVVPEGMKMTKSVTSIVLDPAATGGVQEIKVKAANINDIIPHSEPETKVTVSGNPVANVVESSIDGAKMGHLITVPYGCGEQNMISLTPTVITTHFLDSTNQWEKIGVDRRAEALKLIMSGYSQQLSYKKPDYSYAAFLRTPSSTWLTAYVAKVFALAKRVVGIESQVICGAVKWLILEKQKPDGVFKEDAPVMAKSMMGGYQGAEPEVSLTAFVLIALLESRDVCDKLVPSLKASISKAEVYLSTRYPSLARPYTVALVSYALAHMGKLGNEEVLMNASSGGNHWKDTNAYTYSVEATAYALLALLRMKKFELARPIVRWLSEAKFYEGRYGSTQAIIMVFQALAQYQIDIPRHEELNLDVSIFLPGRATPINYRVLYENAMVVRTAETRLNQDFVVKAKGTGQGTLTVVTVYNAKIPENTSQCKKFDLKVAVKEALHAKKPEGTLRSVYINICTRYRDVVNATMSILSVSMLTGFSPDISDLKALSNTDRYISKYEIDRSPSDRSMLIIYLNKISHVEEECLQFKAHQFFEVGLIQPGSVTVYEYYSLDEKCTMFYRLPDESGFFSKICQGDVCRCAEENCFLRQKVAGPITLSKRFEMACEPGIDYVYKVKLVGTNVSSNHDYHMMEVLQVIKAGSDEHALGETRTFVSHVKCRQSLNLELNKDYLIWGVTTDLWLLKGDFSYLISKDTWIELWPQEQEDCQEEKFQTICQDLEEFSQAMIMIGCST
ncbi:complement C3-like [Carettochelys insculpta]|uniref:complement C3-like n=1 Tax=Carettochelys insculpta TaxID=44489 RepID=UPI003EBA3731